MASKSFRTWRKFTTAVDDVFKDFTDGSERMSYPEFCAMLENVDKGLRALPATAQVAKQEGQYLASFFNDCAGDDEQIQTAAARFDYVHKGSLAYIGKDAAVADIPGSPSSRVSPPVSSGSRSKPSPKSRAQRLARRRRHGEDQSFRARHFSY